MGLDAKLFSFLLRVSSRAKVIIPLSSPFSTLSSRLTLTELEATTSLRLTWLLTLNLTAITCQETSVLQLLLILFVHLDEGTGDSHAQGLALASETTTVEVHLDVVLLSHLEQVQRLLNHVLQDGRGEINFEFLLVDRNLTRTFLEIHTSYRALATTDCIYYFPCFTLSIIYTG